MIYRNHGIFTALPLHYSLYLEYNVHLASLTISTPPGLQYPLLPDYNRHSNLDEEFAEGVVVEPGEPKVTWFKVIRRSMRRLRSTPIGGGGGGGGISCE